MKRPAQLLLLLVVAAVAVATAWWLGHDHPASLASLDAGDGVTSAITIPAATAASPRTNPTPMGKSDGGLASASHGVARAKGTVVIHGKWGSGPGQFGRKHDRESNPEAPMAMAAGAGGALAIVDQVNRRVERFENGKLSGTISTGGDTVQDLAFGANGSTVLLDRLADRNVQIYDRGGKLINEAPLVGDGIPEGGAVTGVFADDNGVYVEREHGTVVQIADGSGNTVPQRDQLPGRPTRDGRLLIAAAIADRAAGTVTITAYDRASRKQAWQQLVPTGAPILTLLMLDSDRQGMVYLGAETGQESPEPPFAILDEAIAVVRLGPGGNPRGALSLPATPTPDESFRSMSVSDDGEVYVMAPAGDGLDVVRYSF